jgi:hypothetical protein
MNIGRGLFRGWIFVSALWLVGMGTLVYFDIGNAVSHWKWQYEHQSRTSSPPWEIDWARPYYEAHRSPSAEKLAVTFNEVSDTNMSGIGTSL